MTPTANQALCRKIADAEYPDAKILNIGSEIVYVIREGHATRPIPRYLTDPAETVRMLKALVDHYDYFDIYRKGGGTRVNAYNFDKGETEGLAGIGEEEIAVAQAYLAMLKEIAGC